jgi:hypothetical protein
MVGQLLPNTNEMLQCILPLQNLDLNTAKSEESSFVFLGKLLAAGEQ